MTFNNLPTVVLGLALIASLGGCCTSGTCGTASRSSEQVYSAPSYDQAPASDCGCGCSAASDSAMSYESSGSVVSGDSYSQPEFSTASPSVVGEATSSFSAPTPVVEVPSIGGTSGFTAGSSSKANALP